MLQYVCRDGAPLKCCSSNLSYTKLIFGAFIVEGGLVGYIRAKI
jgi:hypothetical protein